MVEEIHQQILAGLLAGRSAIHHLLPLAASEILGVPPLDIDRIGEELPQRPALAIPLFEMLHRGFYPPIHDRDIPAQDWLGNYYRTYPERDVRELINIGDVDAFARFVRLCAGRCGQLLNLVSLANDCGISQHTESDETLLVMRSVLNGDCRRVFEHCYRIGKLDAVLIDIFPLFPGTLFDFRDTTQYPRSASTSA